MSAGSLDSRPLVRLRRLPTGFWPTSAAALVVALVFDALIRHERGHSGDEPYYVRMADHPGGAHNFPYAFRIGVPDLVHVLPFSHAFSWDLVALVAASLAAGALGVILAELGTPAWLCLALALGFVVSPPLLVTFLRNGVSVDPASVMVINLGALCILRRHRLGLGLCLFAGATVHESCLFLIPFAYAYWASSPLDRVALRDVAISAVAPAALYIYLRARIVAVGEVYQPGYEGPFLRERVDVLKDALGHGGWRGEVRRLALVYGPLWLVAPRGLIEQRFTRAGLVLVALCIGSMTFALDWGRAILYAAPVIYAAGASVLGPRRRLALAGSGLLIAMDIGYAVYMQLHGVQHGLDVSGPPSRGPVH